MPPALAPKPKRCPLKRCRSTRIDRHGPDSKLAHAIARAVGNPTPCPIDVCMDCRNVWEVSPEDDPPDEPTAERILSMSFAALLADLPRISGIHSATA